MRFACTFRFDRSRSMTTMPWRATNAKTRLTVRNAQRWCGSFRALFIVEQRNRFSERMGRVETEHSLLMPIWVLFAPQLKQEGRHLRKYGLGPMNLCVARGTERDHELQE